METILPFAISILIGLLVGIEREKAHPQQSAMGVRTFLLLSLLGSIASWIEYKWMGAFIAAFAFSLIALSYISTARHEETSSDLGLTTEVAGAIVFSLGYGSHQDPALVALLGPFVALVLFWKEGLHKLTSRIRPSELEASILLLLLGVAVLSLLDDQVIDPWGLFNPRKFGLLVLILAVLEFSSYLAVKFLGEKKSSVIIGFLGGLVSSTAVTLSVAREAAQSPESWRRHAATTITAKLASLGELLLIVGLVSMPLLSRVVIPVALACAVGAVVVFFLTRSPQLDGSTIQLKSPLDVKGVLRLAVFLAVILGVVGATERWLGEEGTKTVVFLTGLVELQGVSLATATLFGQNLVTISAATLSIFLAILGSLVSKVVMTWIIARDRFSVVVSAVFVVMGAILGLSMWLPFLG